MSNTAPPLRELRDRLLAILYDLGQGSPFFAADGREAQARFGGTRQQFDSAFNVLLSQGCINTRGPVGSIPLSDEGQRQAERLQPAGALRDPPAPAVVHVETNYGIVQGGSGNTQTVTFNIDNSRVETILAQIEHDLDSLPIPPAVKEEARGHLQGLREGVLHKLPSAALRAMAAALASVLTGAGSELGSQLVTVLGAQPA